MKRKSRQYRLSASLVFPAVAVLLSVTPASAELTADSIIDRLDDNSTAASLSFAAKMTISLGGQTREKSFEGYADSSRRAYFEFTAPSRDRNTRFLRDGSDMWMWLPRVGKSTKLSGHLLRQSMMGSDFSYSDAAENSRLLDDYQARLLGTDTVMHHGDAKTCYVVELTAKTEDVDYARQKVWVTPDDFIAAKVEFYAASGKLLKEMRVMSYQLLKGRNYPTKVQMTNLLRKDTYTVMEFTDIELDPTIPDEVFTKSYLER
ncbi:MAG: outer membrane lipoprotein-sorting protein [candidate division WOR-3 bacterium]|nr:MAG: outer membrane lipoprotein-sorting protein [candidate division WOR-3 bacterium]